MRVVQLYTVRAKYGRLQWPAEICLTAWKTVAISYHNLKFSIRIT